MAANYYDSLRPSLQIQPVSYYYNYYIFSQFHFICNQTNTRKQIRAFRFGFGKWKVEIIYRGQDLRAKQLGVKQLGAKRPEAKRPRGEMTRNRCKNVWWSQSKE